MRTRTAAQFASAAQLRREAGALLPPESFVLTTLDAREHYFTDPEATEVAQMIHRRFRTNPDTLHDHVTDLLALRGTEELLDLGCGNGALLEDLRPHLGAGHMVGLDISPSMLAAARARLAGVATPCEFVEADAQDLSLFPDDSFDRVSAVYMAHYVNDLQRCFAEVRRILRPGGLFLLVTDDPATMLELWRVHYAALDALSAPASLYRATPKGRISLENGTAQLAPHFETVTVHRWQDQLQFASLAPFVAFYRANQHCCASSRTGAELPDHFCSGLEAWAGQQVQHEITHNGYFAVTKITGAFVCH